MSALTFDAATHTYAINGRVIPWSVTGVLRDVGLIDYSGVPAETLEAARARGTAVHNALATLAAYNVVFIPDELVPYADARDRFVAESGVQLLAAEVPIYHHRLDYAGTVDALCYWPDQTFGVIDWKCGSASDACADLQTAAYAEALRASPPPEWADIRTTDIIRRHAVELRDDGSYRLRAYSNPLDFQCFAACLTVANLRRTRKALPR